MRNHNFHSAPLAISSAGERVEALGKVQSRDIVQRDVRPSGGRTRGAPRREFSGERRFAPPDMRRVAGSRMPGWPLVEHHCVRGPALPGCLLYDGASDCNCEIGIAASLVAESYVFGGRVVRSIPKSDGSGFRDIQLAPQADRVAARLLARALRASVAARLERRKARDIALRAQEFRAAGFTWVVRFDFASFFDSISVDAAIDLLTHIELLPWVRIGITRCLRAPAVRMDGTPHTGSGLPQGCPLSGPLAQLYVFALRKQAWAHRDVRFLLYVDDGVLLGRSKLALAAGWRALSASAAELGLRFRESKTMCLGPSADVPYLGFVLRNGSVSVEVTRVERILRRIRLALRKVSRTPTACIAAVNTVLRREATIGYTRVGWLRYYSLASDAEAFERIDRSVRDQLRSKLGKRFSNARLARLGLVSAARVAARYHKLLPHWDASE